MSKKCAMVNFINKNKILSHFFIMDGIGQKTIMKQKETHFVGIYTHLMKLSLILSVS